MAKLTAEKVSAAVDTIKGIWNRHGAKVTKADLDKKPEMGGIHIVMVGTNATGQPLKREYTISNKSGKVHQIYEEGDFRAKCSI